MDYLTELWDCVDCSFTTIYRQKLRNHFKITHNKIMCRCSMCNNEAKSDGSSQENYCKKCANGKCPNCGLGTRGG